MRIPRWLRPDAKTPKDELADILGEAKSYFIAETIDPLKLVGRTLLYGLSGALVAGLGLVLCLVGLLRVLETEVGTTFSGTWTFVPYLCVAFTGLLVAVLAVSIGFRRYRKQVKVS